MEKQTSKPAADLQQPSPLAKVLAQLAKVEAKLADQERSRAHSARSS